MSVKFEKETVRESSIPGGRKHEIAHEIGERLTGGDTVTGYLAVCPLIPMNHLIEGHRLTHPLMAGLP